MWKPIALVACCVMVVTPFALADEGNSTTTPPAPACPPDSLGQARSIIHDSYALKRYRHRPALGPDASAALDALSACLSPSEAKQVAEYQDEKRHDLGVYRAYRKVATIKCTPGLWGYWSKIAANTCACIGAESSFSWTARNPSSSAAGPYQILIGRIYPARTREQQLQNHRRAAEIYREQGGGAWVAPPCG